MTPELLAANNLDALTLPKLDKFALYDLGLTEDDLDQGLPSLEDGYTDRWEVPTSV